MGWIDWLRYVLTPLLVAVLAASVATRNARKTPHERLKNLVDIHDKMPAGLDRDNVVEAAIVRELVDFDRRTAAAQRGLRATIKERAVQLNPALTVLAVPLTAVAIFAAVALIGGTDAVNQSAAGAVAALVAGVATLISYRVTRAERQDRNSQQNAAVDEFKRRLARYTDPPDDPETQN